MSIHPRRLPASPEESMWGRLGDLSRGVGQGGRADANSLQRCYKEGAGLTGITALGSAPVDLLTCSVNIPSTDSRVMFWYSADVVSTDAATTGRLSLDDGTVDFPVGWYILVEFWNTTSDTAAPALFGQNAGPSSDVSYPARLNVPLMVYGPHAAVPAAPTPGDRDFTLTAARIAGTGSVSITNVKLWVAVV